jgi:L-asparaginase
VSSELPRVTVFSLGGTIASTNAGGETLGVVPQLDASDLVSAVPELRGIATFETVGFRQTSSGDLTLLDLMELAREIDRRFDDGVVGVIVTQGTDTIEEVSFALELLVVGSPPVVVTGAMRDATKPGGDGPANLVSAACVAVSPQSRGLGTVVVLNDQIHAARFVRKTNTSSPSTFESPTSGPIGWIVENRVRVALRTSSLKGLLEPSLDSVPDVALFEFALGDDARLLRYVDAAEYAGIVVEGLGGGHVPSRAVPELARLASSMPVVLASRTGSGDVLTSTYGFEGSEIDLLSRGLISAGFLDGRKARIFLSYLLASGSDISAVRTSFAAINDALTAG